MGAVVLNVDLQSLAGVSSLSGTQVCALLLGVALTDSVPFPDSAFSVPASVELSSAINENQLDVF